MTIVAVTQRVDLLPQRQERRDALDQRLCAWLASAGCVPVPVPNSLGTDSVHDDLAGWLKAVAPGAVVLSGGNDPGAMPERDRTERQLLDWASASRLPALGICRGMQMMALWAGGALKRVAGHVRTRHRLAGEINGTVNSFHDLAIDGCPNGFMPTARAEDGEIEAMRHATLPWEAWMWHPEREAPFDARDTARLKKLLGG